MSRKKDGTRRTEQGKRDPLCLILKLVGKCKIIHPIVEKIHEFSLHMEYSDCVAACSRFWAASEAELTYIFL